MLALRDDTVASLQSRTTFWMGKKLSPLIPHPPDCQDVLSHVFQSGDCGWVYSHRNNTSLAVCMAFLLSGSQWTGRGGGSARAYLSDVGAHWHSTPLTRGGTRNTGGSMCVTVTKHRTALTVTVRAHVSTEEEPNKM